MKMPDPARYLIYSGYGLNDEPIISESIKAGADVVTFSGDKLIGGTQAGLIVGKKEVIETIRKHPLYRALRASKVIYAALEATLESFRKGTAAADIPVLQMLSMTQKELKLRTESFATRLKKTLGQESNLQLEIIEGKSVVGGGSAPAAQPNTILLSLEDKNLSINNLEAKLRLAKTPVVARILDNKVVLDLRTVFEKEEDKLIEILVKIDKDKSDLKESSSAVSK